MLFAIYIYYLQVFTHEPYHFHVDFKATWISNRVQSKFTASWKADPVEDMQCN